MKKPRKRRLFGTTKITSFEDTEEGRPQAKMFKDHYKGIMRKKGKMLHVFAKTNMEQKGDWHWEKGGWKVFVHWSQIGNVPNMYIEPPSIKRGLTRHVYALHEIKELIAMGVDSQGYPIWARHNIGRVPAHMHKDLYAIMKRALEIYEGSTK